MINVFMNMKAMSKAITDSEFRINQLQLFDHLMQDICQLGIPLIEYSVYSLLIETT